MAKEKPILLSDENVHQLLKQGKRLSFHVDTVQPTEENIREIAQKTNPLGRVDDDVQASTRVSANVGQLDTDSQLNEHSQNALEASNQALKQIRKLANSIIGITDELMRENILGQEEIAHRIAATGNYAKARIIHKELEQKIHIIPYQQAPPNVPTAIGILQQETLHAYRNIFANLSHTRGDLEMLKQIHTENE